MKKWIGWGLALLLLLSVLIAFLPTVLAQQTVRKWILDELLAQEGLEADIEQVRLGWFSPTRVNGVSMGPIDRPRLLSVDQIRSDRTFWNGLTEGIDVGDLIIEHPRITLWFEGDMSNLDFQRQKPLDESDPSPLPATASMLRLTVTDAELWLKTETMPNDLQVFGHLDLQGTLSKNQDGRRLSIDSGRILDHAAISPELCRGGLKYILPILAEATWTKGELSIDLDACAIDLDEPRNSRVSGKLHIHGIEAGIKNELLSAVGDRIALLLGRDGFDAVHLAKDSVVEFQVRDGLVWHTGVEFGLPRVNPDLVVRTSGSVSFAEELDLLVDLPRPLQLLAVDATTDTVDDTSLTLHVRGTLSDPQVKVEDDDFLANLISRIGGRLADEEKPLQSVIQGIRDRLPSTDGATSDDGETPILDKILERTRNRQGPLRRLFRGKEEADP